MFGFSKLFSASEVAKDVVGATISAGDKMFYTDEEKADNKKEMIKFFPSLLKAYHPFKLAQRILAIWFSFLFGLSFLIGLFMFLFNSYIKYTELRKGVKLENIILLDYQPLIDLVIAFNLGTIILAIVAFYFTGGLVSSFKKDN